MFTKNSRYARLPDVVTTERQGRPLPSKSLRLLPEVTGDFEHPIAANDRLDHLAYKYYQRSGHWWHICDANPTFLSPLALLGKEPIQPTRFRVVWNDEAGPPPWASVQRALADTVGVHDVQVEDGVQLEFRTLIVTIEGAVEPVPIANSSPDRALLVVHNIRLIAAGNLIRVIEAQGFQQVRAEEQTRLGKPITIPPANVRNR